MRWTRWMALAAVVCLAGGRLARADDEAGAGDPTIRAAVEALKVRMEARLALGRALEKQGRLEEALKVYEQVDALWAQGMAEIRTLLGSAGSRPSEGSLPGEAPLVDQDLPIDEGSPGQAFKGRGGGGHPPERKRSDDAVEHALRWLAAHQSPDGSWDAAGFGAWCDGKPAPVGGRPDGTGKSLYNVGVTGLATCAFLGAGYTNRGAHPFAKVVAKALRFLKSAQDPEGCFGPRTTQHYVYNHAFAALAMVEAYGMTGSPIFKGSAQSALDFIALSRNPYFAWRYGVKPGDNDTSVTGGMAMVLKSAKVVNADAVARGLQVPLIIDEEAFDGIRAWIEKMTDLDYGRVGYIQRGQGVARPQELVDKFPGDKSEAMTAVGVLVRVFGGEDPSKSILIQKGAHLMSRLPPVWNPNDGSIDMYYWYYGSLAMFQVGGEAWAAWSRAMEPAMINTQRLDGDYCGFKGSWDPVDPWGPDGGRVYSTAVLAMCLEVFFRYDRAFGAR